MKRSETPPLSDRAAKILLAASVSLLLLGAIVLYGWITYNMRIIRIFPSWAPMTYNTGLSFIFSGLSLLSYSRRNGRWGAWFALFPSMVGILTLLETAFDVSLGIDTLFFNPQGLGSIYQTARMTANASLAFATMGITLLSLNGLLANRQTQGVFAEGCALIIALATQSLFSYFLGLDTAFGWGRYFRMAIHTGFGFLIGGSAILYAFLSFLKNEETSTEVKLHKYKNVGYVFILSAIFIVLQTVYQIENISILKSVAHSAHVLTRTIDSYLNDMKAKRNLNDLQFVLDRPDFVARMKDLVDLNRQKLTLEAKHSDILTGLTARISPTLLEHDLTATRFLMAGNTQIIVRLTPTKEFVAAQRAPGNIVVLILGGILLIAYSFTTRLYIARTLSEFTVTKTRLQHQEFFRAVERTAIVSMTDPQGKIIFANDGFERVSGYGRAELLGQDHRIVNSGYHDKSFFKEMWQSLLSGKTWQGEVQNRAKNGKPYWVHAVNTPIFDSEGAIESFLSVRFDITEKKRLEQASFQSSKLASLGEMASGIAHEVNSPLAIIMGTAAALRRNIKSGAEPEKLVEGAEKIEKMVERIATIMNGLRGAARDSSKDPMQAFPLQRILDDTLAFCDARLKNHGINLQMDLAILQDVAITCRPAQITQVLLNLLNNAYDAIHDTKDAWISITASYENGNIVLRIGNSGPKISQSIQTKLFQPFFTTKEIGKGTGLGLSISRNLVQQHEGTLTFDDSSTNTCFVITLPTAVHSMKQVA